MEGRKKRDKIDRKLLIAVAVVLIIIIITGVCLATGVITEQDIHDFLNSLTDPDSSNTPSPSQSPLMTDNILLVGNELTGQTLDIHFIDVGQGDAIYIEFPDGKTMLIDGGDTGQTARAALLSYLQHEEGAFIDYLMLTHTDADHVGSLDDVIDAYPVKNFYIPNLIASDGMANEDSIDGSISTLAYFRFIERVNNETYTEGGISKKSMIYFNQDILIISEESYTMTLYCPSEEYYGSITNNSSAQMKNNMSPVCVLEYGGRVIVFTGDADKEAEDRFIAQTGKPINADVLKVAHHGSEGSSNSAFLAHIDAEYAIISCGKDNAHKHPRQEAIDRLIDAGAEYLFRTDLHSDILLEIDGLGNMRFTLKQYISQEIAFRGYSVS